MENINTRFSAMLQDKTLLTSVWYLKDYSWNVHHIRGLVYS
jgi:hypothetical protein